jgi:hypothetical protein
MSDFKVGDHVWGIQRGWCEGIINGEIKKFETTTDYKGKSTKFVYIRNNYAMLSGYVKEDDIYKSKSDAEKAYKEEIQNRIKEYKSRINTVEDLVKFMFNENVTCAEEYTDYEARQAAIEKAKELLGIELGE